MSWVTNFMIHADSEDLGHVRELSSWLANDAPRRDDWEHSTVRGVGSLAELTNPLDNHWGGWKNPECELWAGALNHADLDTVIEKIASLPWQNPDRVQVFVMDQHEDYFRVYMCRDGAWNQYAPAPPADANDEPAA